MRLKISAIGFKENPLPDPVLSFIPKRKFCTIYNIIIDSYSNFRLKGPILGGLFMASILRFENNLRAGVHNLGEGLILDFYGTPSKTRKLAYKNSFNNVLGEPSAGALCGHSQMCRK